MGTTEKRVHRSRAQWQAVIARAARSPLGVSAFCRGEGISTASFYTGRRRLADGLPGDASAPGGEPAFLDLGALAGATATGSAWDIELELGAGVVLRRRRG
jgi:putative transposase